MKTLSDIRGQPAAIGMLQSSFASGRVPHGLIFAGPEGVGKGTTAEAVSRLFLCEKAGDGTAVTDACGTCASCQLMAAGTHPDFHRVYRQLIRLEKKDSVARDLSVWVVRKFLVEIAGRSTQLGRGKVFVIEEADAMNAEAQNAMLKTLEEPYGRTLIILLTTEAGLLLPTIRSRCQPVRFAPLPESVVMDELAAAGIDPALARDAAKLAEGSLGVALRFARDGLVPVAKELEQRLTAALTGKGTSDLPKFLKDSGDAVAEKIMERDPDGSNDQAKREGLGLLMQVGADVCRRYMRLARTRSGLEKLCAAVEKLSNARTQLEANVNVSLVLQQLSAELEA